MRTERIKPTIWHEALSRSKSVQFLLRKFHSQKSVAQKSIKCRKCLGHNSIRRMKNLWKLNQIAKYSVNVPIVL